MRSEGIDSGESYVWCITATATQLRQHLEHGRATPQEVAMERRIARALCALISIIAVFTTRAADAPQPLVLLKSGDYASLDHQLNALQAEYETGRATEEQLYTGFRQLYEDSTANERYFSAWVQAYPNSYAAHLARGTYYYRMAWFIRGEEYLRTTPRSQVNSMTEYLSAARPDLLASMELTAKPYLSALYMLNVTQLNGSEGDHRYWFKEGMRIDPTNTKVRVRYMETLRPRWGGSYVEMQDFLAQTRRQSSDPQLLARLEILIHHDQAEDAMQADENSATKGSSQAVFDEWKKVIDLSEIAQEDPSDRALAAYMRAASDLNMKADLDRGVALLAKRNIDDGWSLERIAWALIQQHRDADALPSLRKAAALSQPWSQFVLGKTLYDGCPELNIKADQQAGLAWIQRSARLCHREATQFLTSHGLPPGCDSEQATGFVTGWLSSAWGRGLATAAVVVLLLTLAKIRRRPLLG